MKTWKLWVAALGLTGIAAAQPWKVAVLDFEDQTGQTPDAALGGGIAPAQLARKGVAVLAQALANEPRIVVVDRRDFLNQLTRAGTNEGPQVSAIRAAQLVGADLILRGAIQSFSSSKTALRQGGHSVDLATVTLRVAVEALDATDGAIVAVGTGSASRSVRQTDQVQTVLGEAEVLTMLEEAVRAAVPQVTQSLTRRAEELRQRPTVRVNIRTTADPALVEIDGVLVGTTPLEGHRVVAGDHTLTIGKAGYRDIRKRIRFDQDVQIVVPMLRAELSAEEIKDVLDKARVHAVIGEPAITILPLQ